MTSTEPSDTVARVPNCVARFTWHVVGSVVLPCIAIYTSVLQNALADLPIHATPSDIHGLWLFSLSPPARGTVHSCGSTTPNKNSSNLRPELQDYKSFLETHGGVHKEIRLHLADKPVPFSVARTDAAARGPNRQSWKALGVFDGENSGALVGSWTTVYDEGFEVFIGGGTRMMGFMKYSQDPACDAVPRDGDLEDNSGHTRCYITDARRTHMGWYNHDDGKGEFLTGCFYAERLDSPAESGPSAFVVVQEAQTAGTVSFLSATQVVSPSSGQQQKQAPPDLAYYVSQAFVDTHNSSLTSTWRAGLNPVFAHADSATLSKYIKNFGVKEIFRENAGKYQAAHSFMQSGTSSASEGSSANQLYACPCKKGERPLDTRMENSGAPIPVLSPLSTLEFGGRRTFLASIAPHTDKSSSSVGKEEDKLDLKSRKSVEAVVHLHHAAGANRKGSDMYTTPLASLEISTEGLPANFSWSDPFSAAAFEEEVINQGACGSCYAVAATYALQKRFEIAASKMLGRDVKLFGHSSVNSEVPRGDQATSFMDLRDEIGAQGNLSAQSVLSCSFYNQGCDGGFPYLVGKHARDIGIPQENCMSYQATDKTRCPLQSNLSFLDREKEPALPSLAGSLMETESQACVSNARWFAKDYGYVGACYECNQCSGERMIMEEIYQNGPVAAALEAPQSLFSYESGIFDVDPSREHHSRVCDMNSAECEGLLTGWEFTNHAVAIVGWGEDASKDGVSAESQKYWIVRNTWGPQWGKKGYVKIARGKNLGGIESQTTWIDPDFTRGMGRAVAQRLEALKRTAVESA